MTQLKKHSTLRSLLIGGILAASSVCNLGCLYSPLSYFSKKPSVKEEDIEDVGYLNFSNQELTKEMVDRVEKIAKGDYKEVIDRKSVV